MGVRFRKYVKIMPGVRLNISKSGLSTTIGPRGASVNIGKKGAFLNTGIPGTGIYMREKISKGPTEVRKSSTSNKSHSPEFLRLYEKYKPLSLVIDDSGKITIIDKNDNTITDEYFLRKLKATDEYKAEKELLLVRWEEANDREYREEQDAMVALININRYSVDVRSLEEYEQELAGITKKQYQRTDFDEKEPTKQDVEAILMAYANQNITSKAFWRVSKLREQYVHENLEVEYQKQLSEWQQKKQEFDTLEQEKMDEQNTIFEKEYEETCALMRSAISGSEDYIKEQLEEKLSNYSLPVEINLDYEYESPNGILSINILLPPEEVIPHQEKTRLANGGLKEKSKTRQKIQEEYAKMIFGLSICIASAVFDISPAIKHVLISGYASNMDKDDDKDEICLYTIKYDRSGFEGAELKSVDPIEFINCFENRYKATKTWVFKAVTPFDAF